MIALATNRGIGYPLLKCPRVKANTKNYLKSREYQNLLTRSWSPREY